MWIVIVFFLPFFCPILVDVQKHYKIGISAHFKKQKIEKKSILRCYYLGQVGVIMAEKPHKKKNKFLGTEVPRNFSDQCSLDFAYFLCLFSGRRSKSSQELCSWELFFLILGGFSPCDFWGNGREASQNSTSSAKNPMETAERSIFGLLDRNNTEDDKVRDINRAPKIAFSLRSRAFRATRCRSPCGFARSHSERSFFSPCPT